MNPKSHGDGAVPLGRQADVPAPGRQLPQAKPGWWLGREPIDACGVIPASRARALVLREAAVKSLRIKMRVSAAAEGIENNEEAFAGLHGNRSAGTPTVLLRVIDSDT